MFTATQSERNVIIVNCTSKTRAWEQWFLLRSDAHHDNPDCNQELEKHHLKQAIDRGAGILDFGDLFCAMQGKYDKRSDKAKVRAENQNGSYIDSIVKSAADFYEPYAKNWIVMGRGNHEQSIKARHETDLTERLTSIINDRAGTSIQPGGYTGWVRFSFDIQSRRAGRNLWYTHGYGGGGPVTEDMIQSSRQRVYIDGADIMCSGHVHRQWHQRFVKLRLSQLGKQERRYGDYVKLPTYKDEYKDGYEGFTVEKGMGPRPIGAWWLRFFWDGNRGLQQEITSAVG